jgi:hypothetical protein
VGPRTSLDNVERRKILPLPGFEFRPLGHSARSQWLYRLRCSEQIILIPLNSNLSLRGHERKVFTFAVVTICIFMIGRTTASRKLQHEKITILITQICNN